MLHPELTEAAAPPWERQSAQATLRDVSAVNCVCQATARPGPESKQGGASRKVIDTASPNDELMTRTAPLADVLRRHGENRPIGPSYWSETHDASSLLLAARWPAVLRHVARFAREMSGDIEKRHEIRQTRYWSKRASSRVIERFALAQPCFVCPGHKSASIIEGLWGGVSDRTIVSGPRR
ncbi:hypothetical protein Purlil1_13763 [Purpureocillium lilacinum]|uniref:Uncharacterized protein n=1 Tax=Purpureocillium lilacinum TaxID=33203 RepID=A0ABR0BDH1_PURLI|nr:hypothetical protein Purlil1_13763 [Purpureocillium lilacinum]